jgi:alkanesulfonate monooxygenase SsuD/methylene tetrahydromethanopterin reductase-like flavin-dependent oxidoreductase (luciferase family)
MPTRATLPPLSPGSVSLRLYPHDNLPADAIVAELCAQGRAAAEVGFDGVMTSEHHNGFAGYLPNPIQVAGWLLQAMSSGWAAACPLLLPLRPPALVAEEVAWLAARFPGRVGLGVAAGSLQSDFDIMGSTKVDLTRRFADGLAVVAGMLNGSDAGPLPDDRAVARCGEHPVPVVSAAMSMTAARRAARLGVGLVFDSLSSVERCRQLADVFRDSGGTHPTVMVRRTWIGEPPRAQEKAQMDVYRSYAASAAQSHWGEDELVGGDDPRAVATRLAEIVVRARADALNLRVHVPGVSPGQVRDQIALLEPVVEHLHGVLPQDYPSR